MNSDEVAPTEWRSQLQPEARSRIVTKITDTLRKHLPISGPEGLAELKKIAVRFEEKIFSGATTTSQADYLRKISMKMLSMEPKIHVNGAANAVATSSNIVNQTFRDVGLEMRSYGRGDSWGSGWRQPQGDNNMNPVAAAFSEWQSQLQPEARSRIVAKIMDMLKKHLPTGGPEGLDEVKKMAVCLEEEVFSEAKTQDDYLRKLSMKMLSMELEDSW